MLTYQTEAEINGVSTEIEVDYDMAFSQPEIACIMNLETKELVEVNEIDNVLLLKAELSEWAMNVSQVSMEYLINNA